MKRNILWYIGFIIGTTALVILWRNYGITAWFCGIVVGVGVALENCGYEEE